MLPVGDFVVSMMTVPQTEMPIQGLLIRNARRPVAYRFASRISLTGVHNPLYGASRRGYAPKH